MVSSAYLRLLIFLVAILIPACASPRAAFHIMYSAYELNKQGDSIQPWRPPFLIWNQSVVPCPVLAVASWPAYRFLWRQVKWVVFPSLSEFSMVCCGPHSQKLQCSQYSGSRCFSESLLLFWWSIGCWGRGVLILFPKKQESLLDAQHYTKLCVSLYMSVFCVHWREFSWEEGCYWEK